MTHIGLRNLKTALAVVICMVISKAIKLEYPFFTAIAAIISMENSILHSFKAGRSRMVGTFIGACIGLVCALIAPGSALLCGIGLIGVIYCCNLLKWRKPVQLAGVVFMAIMVGLKGANPLQYSFNRIVDTFIGISVAVIVNYLIFPPDYLPRIRHSILRLLQTAEQTLRQIVFSFEKADLAEYKTELAKANELVILYCDDQKIYPWKKAKETPALQQIFAAFDQILHHFHFVSQGSPLPILNETNALQIKNIFGWNHFPFSQSSGEDFPIVFNYHFHELLTLYQMIKELAVEQFK